MCVVARHLEMAKQYCLKFLAAARPLCKIVTPGHERRVASGAYQVLLKDCSLVALWVKGDALDSVLVATRAGKDEPSVATRSAAKFTRTTQLLRALQAPTPGMWVPDALKGHANRWFQV